MLRCWDIMLPIYHVTQRCAAQLEHALRQCRSGVVLLVTEARCGTAQSPCYLLALFQGEPSSGRATEDSSLQHKPESLRVRHTRKLICAVMQPANALLLRGQGS